MLGWRGSLLGRDAIEGFGVAGIREEMAEPRIELGPVLLGPLAEGGGNLRQGLQVRRWIAIPPGVVGDDVEATLQQGGEFVFHGDPLADPVRAGNCGIDGARIAR